MAEIILTNNSAFLAKAQSVRGVAATYDETNSIIATGTPSIKIDETSIEVDLASTERGGKIKKHSYTKATLEITVDLGMGGSNMTPVAGALPQYDPLVRACAMQRLQSSSFESDTLAQGNRDSFTLAAGASEVDNFYLGHWLSATALSNTSQSTGSSLKNIAKLAAATAEHAGTALSASTTTAVKLASGASSNDDDYVGQSLVIGSDTRTITAYDGATQTATVGTAFGSSTASQAYKVLIEDDGLVGHLFSITHYTGTIIDNASKNSTVDAIYLPGTVGTDNFAGCYLSVTTGSDATETIKIAAYDTSTRKATLKSSLQTAPTNSSTFEVLEKRTIKAYDNATKLVTLNSNLVVAADSGKSYSIQQTRRIVSYDGSTLKGTVSPAFSRNIGPCDYTINPYVMYSALPTKSGEIFISVATYHDGIFYEFIDLKGDFTITMNQNESVLAKFTLQGRLNTYDDADLPENALYKYVPSLVCSSKNSPTVMICGYTDAVSHSFEFAMGNDVAYRDVDTRTIIKGHAPMVKSKLDKPYRSDWDYMALMHDNSVGLTFYSIGDIGNSVCVALEKTQITGAADSDTDGVMTVDAELTVNQGKKVIVLC